MKVYKKGSAPASAIYVGRGSAWGNPFVIGTHGDRDEVIAKFYVYALQRLEREPEWLEPLREADGLVCFCAPLKCHGDVIASLLK